MIPSWTKIQEKQSSVGKGNTRLQITTEVFLSVQIITEVFLSLQHLQLKHFRKNWLEYFFKNSKMSRKYIPIDYMKFYAKKNVW